MDQSEKTIFVYENWRSEKPSLIGSLHTSFNKGQESFSFEYADEWLSSFESAYSLDPDLSLYSGRQYTPTDMSLFGLLLVWLPAGEGAGTGGRPTRGRCGVRVGLGNVPVPRPACRQLRGQTSPRPRLTGTQRVLFRGGFNFDSQRC